MNNSGHSNPLQIFSYLARIVVFVTIAIIFSILSAHAAQVFPSPENRDPPAFNASNNYSLISLSVEPSSLIADDIKTATLKIVVNDRHGNPVSGQRIKLFATAGTVSRVGMIDDGVFTATYTVPDEKLPQLVTIIAVNLSSPEKPVAVLRLPIRAKATIPGTTDPGTKVFANLGTLSSEPVIADKDGKFTLRLVISPEEAHRMEILAVAPDGNKTKKNMNIFTPDSKKLSLFAFPQPLPADGVSIARLIVIAPLNKSNASQKNLPLISCSDGMITGIEDSGEGIYSAVFTAPRNFGSGKVTVSAEHNGLKADLQIDLLLGTPSEIIVDAAPGNLIADGVSKSRLIVTVKDNRGNPVVGAAPFLDATTGEIGTITDNKDGTYEATFTAPDASGDGRAFINAEIIFYSADLLTENIINANTEIYLKQAEEIAISQGTHDTGNTAKAEDNEKIKVIQDADGGEVKSIEIFSDRQELIADGSAQAQITIKASGMDNIPVSGKSIVISTDIGKISDLKDNGDGTYAAIFTSPLQPGSAKISASYNNIS
ncbi:MAG: invasin domain 3-containing protein, partial [bacterium]